MNSCAGCDEPMKSLGAIRSESMLAKALQVVFRCRISLSPVEKRGPWGGGMTFSKECHEVCDKISSNLMNLNQWGRNVSRKSLIVRSNSKKEITLK